MQWFDVVNKMVKLHEDLEIIQCYKSILEKTFTLTRPKLKIVGSTDECEYTAAISRYAFSLTHEI